jgi:4-oxalocrotonate tautomerase
MPHVIVKFYPGRSEAEKTVMAARVAAALHDTMGYALAIISVAVEEIERSEWMSSVYGPDIAGREKHLIKRPGYGPLADR